MFAFLNSKEICMIFMTVNPSNTIHIPKKAVINGEKLINTVYFWVNRVYKSIQGLFNFLVLLFELFQTISNCIDLEKYLKQCFLNTHKRTREWQRRNIRKWFLDRLVGSARHYVGLMMMAIDYCNIICARFINVTEVWCNS